MGNPKISRRTLPAHIAPLLPSAAEQRKTRLATGRVVFVCGARDYGASERVFAALYLAPSRARITLLVHGAILDMSSFDLVGTGRWADRWVRERGAKTELHPPAESVWGKAAEAMRSKQMVEAGAHGHRVAGRCSIREPVLERGTVRDAV